MSSVYGPGPSSKVSATDREPVVVMAPHGPWPRAVVRLAVLVRDGVLVGDWLDEGEPGADGLGTAGESADGAPVPAGLCQASPAPGCEGPAALAPVQAARLRPRM